MGLKNWRGGLVILFVALAISVMLSVSLKTSSADVRIPNHPASQGRSLAPAGAIVLDAMLPEIEDDDERAEVLRAPATHAKK